MPPELQPRLFAHICYTLTINHNYEHLDELISLKFVYKTKVKEKYLRKKIKNKFKKKNNELYIPDLSVGYKS